MNNAKNIISLLRNNKDSFTGTELLDIAQECKAIFDKRLKKEKGSKLTCGDIKKCSDIFTDYHLTMIS